MSEPFSDFSRCCIHTFTTKPWPIREAIENYAKAGIPGITIWRQHSEPVGAAAAGKMARDAGLEVVSLCRGGFFPATTAEGRQKALDDNRKTIDEAAAMGAPLIVLVCGAVPGVPLTEARKQITDGIAAVLGHTEASGVKLAVEPLHPMYAGDRSAVNTLEQANDIVEQIGSTWLGVTVDAYHVWWDPDLEAQIQRAGSSVFSFHVCDWRSPTRDLLNDRGLMGEGSIPIRQIREWVERAGFSGYVEVEIFSDEFWSMDQTAYLEKIKKAYLEHC